MSSKKNVERPLPSSLGLPCTGADSHAHLDSIELFAELPAVLQRAKEAGIATIGQVFLSPEAYERGLPVFEAHSSPEGSEGPEGSECSEGTEGPQIFYLLGIHPCDAQTLTSAVYAALRDVFRHEASQHGAEQGGSRLKAVGEIGLDFYWKDCPALIQEEALRLQLALAVEFEKPVAIHSRDAAADTLRILEAEGFANRPVLWHCFSGDALLHIDRILANGWHISIPGPVTYKANEDVRVILRRIPLDRLHLETDCPYLAPEPWRGKRNEPALTAFTAVTVARTLDMSPAELWTLTGNNTRRFFGTAL